MLLKNKKKLKFRPFVWLLIFILLVLAAAGLLYLIFYSNLFQVQNFDFAYTNSYLQEFDISGFFENEYLVSSLTAQVVKKKKFLGYFGSDNILFWFFGKGGNLVNKNTLPSVENVNLDVDLFDRKVKVTVDEKNLSGIICNIKDNCFAFDKEGRVFASAPDTKGSLILKIHDTNDRPLVMGEKFLPKSKWIENVLKTVKVIKDNGLHLGSIEIKGLDLEEWVISAAAGPEFLFNLNFVPKDLSQIVKTLKERADFSQVNYFDMRVENRVYYK